MKKLFPPGGYGFRRACFAEICFFRAPWGGGELYILASFLEKRFLIEKQGRVSLGCNFIFMWKEEVCVRHGPVSQIRNPALGEGGGFGVLE